MKKLPTKLQLIGMELDDYVLETISNGISDYLSNKYGFCVNDYEWSLHIEVENISWDTKED